MTLRGADLRNAPKKSSLQIKRAIEKVAVMEYGKRNIGNPMARQATELLDDGSFDRPALAIRSREKKERQQTNLLKFK